MKKRVLSCLFVLSILAFVGGLCGCAAIPGISVAASAPLPAGQSLILEMEYIPTAGYEWDIDSSGVGRLQVTHQSVGGDASELAGAARVERYVFTATKPGEVTIAITCHQPWEGGDAPLYESLSLRIDEELKIEVLERVTEGAAANEDTLPRISQPVIE